MAGVIKINYFLNFLNFYVMKTKLLISGLAFLAITNLVSGQNYGVPSRPKKCTGKNMAYVDVNRNGICDNYENSTSTASRKITGKSKCCGMGMGMGRGQGSGRRINFVDADKNGIRDYREVPAKK
jgi:hypothetical protein